MGGLHCQGTRNAASSDHLEQQKLPEFVERQNAAEVYAAAGEVTPTTQSRHSPSPEQIEDAVRRLEADVMHEPPLTSARSPPASPQFARPVTPSQRTQLRSAKAQDEPRRNSLIHPRTTPTGNRMPLLVKMRR